MLGIDVIAAITVRLIDRPIDDLGGESAVHIRLDPYAIGAIVDGIDVAYSRTRDSSEPAS